MRAQSLPIADADRLYFPLNCTPAEFLHAVPLLDLTNGILVLEGTGADIVTQWLAQHASREGPIITPGMISPPSDWWYLRIDSAEFAAFAAVVEQAAEVPSAHLHICDADQLVLQWHDAFVSEACISRQLRGPALAQFLTALGNGWEEGAPSV